MRNAYRDWDVRYWDHEHDRQGKPLNDCFGNSLLRQVKARTQEEAVRKVSAKAEKPHRFRLHSANPTFVVF